MAHAGMAPKRLTFLDQKGRPLWCFALALVFGLLAYLAELEAQETVFTWLLSLVGLSSTISWASICYTHLRFRKALRLKNDQGGLFHNRPPSSMPFRSPLGA
jgi:amino acid transporter